MWKHRLIKLLASGLLLTASSLSAATVSPSPFSFEHAPIINLETPRLFQNHKKLFIPPGHDTCGAWAMGEPLTAFVCHSPFHWFFYVGQGSITG